MSAQNSEEIRPEDLYLHLCMQENSSRGLSFDFDLMIGMNGGQLQYRFHEGTGKYCGMPVETMQELAVCRKYRV